MSQISMFSEPAIGTYIEPEIDTSARDESIERVEGGADVIVLHELRKATRAVAGRLQEFTTDDVTDAAGLTPKEPRVLGAVMIWAQKESICAATGVYRQSRDPRCHNRPKMIWRSNIFQGTS